MSLTVTTTQTTDVALTPALKVKLLKQLNIYAALRVQQQAIEAAMNEIKATVGTLREQAGVNSLALEGFHVTQVTSVRTSLDKMKLLAMGVTTDMLHAATVSKPGRPYEKITCPGDARPREHDEA